MRLQLYFDRSRREVFDLGERFDTYDFDFQHNLALGRRQAIVWGLGYRLIADQTNSNSGTPVQYDPKARTLQIFSTFAQDEFTLVKDRLRLTLGAKLEHNDYSGFEFQPNLLMLWTPNARQTLWASASRAVKTPARNDRDVRINVAAFTDRAGQLNLIALLGDPNFKPEPSSPTNSDTAFSQATGSRWIWRRFITSTIV